MTDENREWKELEAAWKEPESAGGNAAPQQIRFASRIGAGRDGLILTVSCLAIAAITWLCWSRASLGTYTFAIIAWSAFLSFASYVLATRDRAAELALDTAAALRMRSRRLARAAALLEFGRVLTGVETLICAGFWLALHVRQGWACLWGTAGIAVGGFLLYGRLSSSLTLLRRELNGLQAMLAELCGGG